MVNGCVLGFVSMPVYACLSLCVRAHVWLFSFTQYGGDYVIVDDLYGPSSYEVDRVEYVARMNEGVARRRMRRFEPQR